MRLLTKILIILTIVASCKDADEPASAGKNAGDLRGDPGLNKYVFANKGYELIRLNPQTGEGGVYFKFEDVNVSSLNYADGVLYVGAMDNSMNAIDLESKKLLWDLPLIEYENTVLADPDITVLDGMAYAAGKTGVLVAVDTREKKVVWARALSPDGSIESTYHLTTTPVISGDKLIIGTSFEDKPNYVHVLNKNTGETIWTKKMADGEFVFQTVKVADNTIVISGSKLQAWDLNTGSKKWEFVGFEDHNFFGAPVISNGRIYIQGSGNLMDGLLFCIDLNTGSKIWEQEAGITSTYINTPTVVGNYVFGVEEHGATHSIYYFPSGRPFLLDAATGKVIWKNEDLFVSTSPVYANGQLFFYGYNPSLPGNYDDHKGFMSLDADTGKFLWINTYFGSSDHTHPIVVADNGVFRSGRYQQ